MFIAQLLHLRPLLCTRIILRDLIDWEIGDVGVGLELGFEGSADAAKLVPDDAAEEGVGFYFLGAVLAGVAA